MRRFQQETTAQFRIVFEYFHRLDSGIFVDPSGRGREAVKGNARGTQKKFTLHSELSRHRQ